MKLNDSLNFSKDSSCLDKCSHVVKFYDDDAGLLESVGIFLSSGLQAGRVAIVIGTKDHREGFAKYLASIGIDVDAAAKENRYLSLDAAEVLESFMIDGWPSEELFNNFFIKLMSSISQTNTKNSHVRVFGEMVSLLWDDGKQEAAIRLEELWNGMAKQFSLSILCAYPILSFENNGYSEWFLRICDSHSDVLLPDGLAESLKFNGSLNQ